MASDNEALLFGRMAVQKGLLSTLQLESALQQYRQLGGAQPLGSILVNRNVLTPLQVQEIVQAMRQVEPRVLTAPPPARPVAVPDLPPLPASPHPAPPPSPAVATPTPLMPAAAHAPAAATGSPKLAQLLEAAERKGASDVHLHANAPLALRVEGKLGLVNQTFEPKDQERMLLEVLSESQRKTLLDTGDLDFAYVTPAGLRTRANMYRTNTGLDATFRILRREPQSLEALGLPAAIAKLVGFHQGLVLVTGPAGSGKSTTLAALVDLLNAADPEHILSLEDPIEIIHPPKKALVNQRQVSRDTESFARALRGALREDPDVIVIGELRDRETISLAITAAETGHLVIGSMQTNSASRTVARLIDSFPPVQQGQVRAMLSESLRGVVSQRLVPGVDGKRIPAVELLIVTPAIGNLIREGKIFQIRSQMQTGKSLGMRTLDESLRELVVAGRISPEVGRKLAESPGLVAPPPAPAPPPPVAAPAAPPPTGAPINTSRAVIASSLRSPDRGRK